MIRRYRGALIKLFVVVILFTFCFLYEERTAFSQSSYLQVEWILDAGHGGEDGGAVSVHGDKESSINLDLVLRLDQILGLLGKQTVLIREEDISLHNPQAVTLREKKISDLRTRVEGICTNPNATLVSIHQNSYPDPQYHGTQVFYAPTDGSKELAQVLQTAVKTTLQPENNRQEKLIPDSVYLMNHIENRAVLVECGFLTNPEEAKQLLNTQYQRKLAVVLAAALAEEQH